MWQISHPLTMVQVWVSVWKQTSKMTNFEANWVKTDQQTHCLNYWCSK